MRIDIYTQLGVKVDSFYSIQPNWRIDHTLNGMRIRLGKIISETSFCTMDVIETIGTNLVIIHEEGDRKYREVQR